MMCDARCPKCKRMFGWQGEPKNCPPCPKCGHQIDAAIIAHDQALIEEGKEMMFARTPETKSGKTEPVWLQDWHPQAYIYVGRANSKYPSMVRGLFGNPFSSNPKSKALAIVESTAQAVEYYRRWLEGDLAIAQLLPIDEAARRLEILTAIPNLRGKRVACYRHDGPCHAQILAELADGPLGDPK